MKYLTLEQYEDRLFTLKAKQQRLLDEILAIVNEGRLPETKYAEAVREWAAKWSNSTIIDEGGE